MNIKVHIIPVLQDNYSYLLTEPSSGKQAIVIDPGEGEKIAEKLKSLGLMPVAILVTHHHFDHIAGIRELYNEWPVEVFAHSTEINNIPNGTMALEDQEDVVIDAFKFKVLHVPGHTQGSCAYLFNNSLFTGDTLFLGGCGRLFEGTAQDLYKSLNNKIKGLPDEVKIYPGHEYTIRTRSFCLSLDKENSLLREKLEEAQSLRSKDLPTVPGDLFTEKSTNVFLRCDDPKIIDSVRNVKGDISTDPLSIFKQLREMMDSF